MNKRLLITFLAVLLLLASQCIPIPWLEWDREHAGWIGGHMGWIGGLKFRQDVSVFTLGVMPYVDAFGLLWALSLIIPPLRRFVREKEAPAHRVALGIALLFAISQALVFIYVLIREPYMFAGYDAPGLLADLTAGKSIVLAALLSAGSMSLIGLGLLVSRKGLGNGIVTLLCASSLPSLGLFLYCKFSSEAAVRGPHAPLLDPAFFLPVALLMAATFFLYTWSRRIPLVKNGTPAGNLRLRVSYGGLWRYYIALAIATEFLSRLCRPGIGMYPPVETAIRLCAYLLLFAATLYGLGVAMFPAAKIAAQLKQKGLCPKDCNGEDAETALRRIGNRLALWSALPMALIGDGISNLACLLALRDIALISLIQAMTAWAAELSLSYRTSNSPDFSIEE